MADNLDSPDFGNFGIENTMEMGMGNPELIQGLFAPETSTASPDAVTVIKDEPPVTKKKVEKITPIIKEVPGEEEKPKKEDKHLESFLLGEEESEEDDEPEVQKTKKKEVDEPTEEVTEDNRFSALSKDLFGLGVFTKEEGEADVEIKTPEEFLERFQIEKKKGSIEIVNNFIGQFGEPYQEAFEAIYVKGVDPREYWSTYNNIENIAEIDLTQESNQESIVRKGLQEQGLDPDKITAKLEKIKSYGDLEDEAKTYHQILVKKEAAKLAQLEQESQQRLQQLASVKQQFVKNVQSVLQEKLKAKEFDGIPINPKLATELQDFLITDKYKTPSGETLTEFDKTILELKRPENHATKVKVGLLLKLLEKDPSLSTIQKAGLTKQTDKLFSEVTKTTAKKTALTAQPKSWFVQT